MVRLGICYCELGIFSQCVADNRHDQFLCDFFEHSTIIHEKCMNHDNNNNHCWSFKAQDFSKIHGVVRKEDVKSSEGVVSGPTIVVDQTTAYTPRRSCLSCENDPGCPLVPIAAAAINKSVIDLLEHDYWDIATNCGTYKPYVGANF
jgi:hypothetical protein